MGTTYMNKNMEWIKVTPETMPPDMKMCMVILNYKGKNHLEERARWNKGKRCWERLCLIGRNEWDRFWNGEVTHWMPYPELAED